MPVPVIPITGKTGIITLPSGASQRVYGVSVNTGSELLDVSAYGGNGYRVRTIGLADLSGTMVAFLTRDGTNPFALSAVTGSLTIAFDTGYSITFDCIFGQVSVAGEVGGNNVVTLSFANAADAAPVIAWGSGS